METPTVVLPQKTNPTTVRQLPKPKKLKIERPIVSDTEIPRTRKTVASEETPKQQSVLEFENLSPEAEAAKEGVLTSVTKDDKPTAVVNRDKTEGYGDKKLTDNEMIGDYALLEKLGQGTYGAVHKALNIETGIPYAIKKFHIDIARKFMVEREVAILQSLSHPNIVKFCNYIDYDPFYYMVMEIVPIGSLHHWLSIYGLLPEGMVKAFTEQIVAGLQYIHSKGIVHKDLKPANILLADNGQIKITDFGLSQLDSDTQKNNLGTMYYKAPELFLDTPSATSKSDIWALGIVILELLNGKPPYYLMSCDKVRANIIKNSSPPIPLGVTQELQHFLKRCFDKVVPKRAEADELLRHQWMDINFDE